MRPALITLTLLFTTASFAQSTPKFPPELPAVTSSACPVTMYARQQGDTAAIWTTSLEDMRKSPALLPHSGVHVDLDIQNRAIKQVELVVYFLPPGTRALPVAGNQFQTNKTPRPETQKNFQLSAGSGGSLKLTGDLLLGPVASITRVTVLQIDYADGGYWRPRIHDTCSIKPSLYMPVDAK